MAVGLWHPIMRYVGGGTFCDWRMYTKQKVFELAININKNKEISSIPIR